MAADSFALNAGAVATTPLRRIQPGGWSSGLGNQVRNELRPWLSTRFGLIQVAVWLAIINGFLALPLWIAPLLDHSERAQMEQPGGPYALGLQVFFQIVVQIGGMGAAILAMGAIVGEKQSGTAAWVLSKPTSRVAFVLSRFIALAAGSTAIIVALQSVVAFVHIGVISGQWPDPALFAASAGLVVAYVLFALALTLMLGAFCKTRGAVIGIAIGILLGQQLLGSFVGPIGAFFPVAIGQVASGIALGQPLASYSAIATAVVLTIVFVGAAVWRFSRDEL